ncbi:putative peptidyl-prolyl cis-trans isomerase Cbf2 precursor [Clostridium tepidiprofundi DSM 19306]|uniref:Putative peptidyl-prolyl cis-trans isomerase Cbf2 n=2 Tax=Clostridium TaxID=1485 RepID=A0A151AW47_9CLOT|nr:putative peptidyl-prolyl cis-trans isomerase Cbf2 precursor [Clostridium tepidiprofundi DSM 19306]
MMNNSKVLAVVNGKEITERDVELLLKGLGPQQAAQFMSVEGKKRLLEELINQELFYSDAVNNNFEEEEDFKREFENMKITMLKQYAMSKLLTSVSVDEEEIRKYYDEHKEMFKSPESVRASHILVKEENEANDILKEINEGLSFEEAAKKYSQCPSSSIGGDLNYFTKGKMVPEFEQAAFSMEKDEISTPVKTQFGYHIIKVTDKKQEETKSFEESKQQISQMLLGMKQNKVYLDKVEELKGKYDVKVAE